MAIEAIAGGFAGPIRTTEGLAQPAGGFAQSLGRLVAGTEQAGAEANQAVGRMLDGSGDVHEAMIALQRADLSMQLTIQIRNKLVSAYQEIMRMPI